jgi:hypothetical protein
MKKKFRFVYLRKTWFKFYQNPDPDPHSSKMLDPDPHITNADPKHCYKVQYTKAKILRIAVGDMVFKKPLYKGGNVPPNQNWNQRISKCKFSRKRKLYSDYLLMFNRGYIVYKFSKT